MSDTIELLEAIGTNASLRYASAQELAQALEQVDASDALLAAAAAGDSSLLSADLGHKPMIVNHDTHSPSHEENVDEEMDLGEDDPGQIPGPDKG
jgi:hypothetical protein